MNVSVVTKNKFTTGEKRIKMKTKCVFCGEWIDNPKMGRMMCKKEECKKEYRKIYRKDYWNNPENRKSAKEYYNKYLQRPGNKKKYCANARAYQQALYKLRNNHKEEFDRIYKKLKQKGIKR